jgi:lipoprotein-anchoring transpeptidase ErfK/SrfK
MPRGGYRAGPDRLDPPARIPGRVYNVCDDDPAPPQDVIAHAAALLDLPPPPEIPFEKADLSPMARSFYAESKRVRNDRIKRELGVRLRYPDYRSGLAQLLSAETRRIVRSLRQANYCSQGQRPHLKGSTGHETLPHDPPVRRGPAEARGARNSSNTPGPEVTRVEVNKSTRTMTLWHHGEVLETFEVELGFEPLGHKSEEGDGRTPEGDYIVDRRNPNSEFYLSIGIDYPNEADIAAAEEAGVDPGGDIFIHGTPRPFARVDDWTAGCIAVTNREMRRIYAMVQDGTPITILP